MRTYCITYDIVTEESAQDGATAENGYMIGDQQVPLPADAIGDGHRVFCDEWGVDVEVTADDGFLFEDYPRERYMAEVICQLPHDYIEPSSSDWALDSWLSLYGGSDAHWAHETEDGTPGTRTLAVHLDGWTEEERAIIFQLVQRADPSGEIY